MYLITGATGNTGSVITKGLLSAGKKVRVVARNPERLAGFAALGAETLAGDLSSQATANQAFAGIEAAYLMLPPDFANPDFRSHQRNLTNVYGAAIEKNPSVRYVVALSSFGADKAEKTGPILGVHFLEERLKQIPTLNSLALRAGYFMENTLGLIRVIQQTGAVLGPLNPDLKLPLIATADIGNAALEALLKLNFQGHQTRELQGQRDLTYGEAAQIIGAAIGNPGLSYRQIPVEQFSAFLLQMGASQSIASLMAEMIAGQNSGHICTLEPRSAMNTTPTSFEQFVASTFATAYNAASAGA